MSLRGLAGINLITFGIHLHGYGFSTGICSLCISESKSFVKLTSSFTLVHDHHFSPSQLKGGLLFYFSNKKAPLQKKHAAESLHLAEHSGPSAFTAWVWTASLLSQAGLAVLGSGHTIFLNGHQTEQIQNRKLKFYLIVLFLPRKGR